MSSAATLRAHLESSLDERLSSTLLLRERVAPATVTTGVHDLDELTGGLPRGSLSEIIGPASSGRTGVMLAALAGATARQEACALVDAGDSFDPASATSAGVDLDRLLWVRCNAKQPAKRNTGLGQQATQSAGLGRLEQVLKATDLLLQGGGFGMVVLDLADLPVKAVRRVPLTLWFRFRRAVENTPTVLLVVEQESCAKTCASLVLALERRAVCATTATADTDEQQLSCLAVPAQNIVSHAATLRGMQVQAEVLRSWMGRKPVQSASAQFSARIACKGR